MCFHRLFSAILLLLLSDAVIAASLSCSAGDFIFRDCSSCLSLRDSDQTYEQASNSCTSIGGRLLEIDDSTDLEKLHLYLEAIGESRNFWVGYRYSSSGERVTSNGTPPSPVLLDESNFANHNSSALDGKCVSFMGRSFFNKVCTENLPFLCQYFHSVPVITTSPDSSYPVYFGLGSNATLNATINGSIASVQWNRNGVPIDASLSGTFSWSREGGGDTFSLTLVGFTDSTHSGTYTVMATTEGMQTFLAARWLVQQAVLGTISSPQSINVTTTQLAGFQCNANDFSPPYQITWNRESAEVSPVPGRVHMVPETGTLFVRNVRNSDAGSYRCTVTNPAGSVVSESAQLNVMSESELGTFNAMIVFIRHTSEVLKGSTFVLDVLGRTDDNVDANVDANVVDILFQRTTTTLNYRYPSSEGFPSFRVDDISESDSVRVSFTSVSKLLDVDRALVRVNVFAAARVDAFTTIQNGVGSLGNLHSVMTGSSAVLACNVSGDPAPNVEWYRDGILVAEAVDSTMPVDNLQATHFYQCAASNTLASDIATQLVCNSAPAQTPDPVSFQVESDSNSSLLVTWNEADLKGTNSELFRYWIRYQQLPMGNLKEIKALHGVRSLMLTNLKSNTDYRVVVWANFLTTAGPEGGEQIVSTFANAPSSPLSPSDITVGYTDDGKSLVVKWEPYEDDGTLLVDSSYEIQYRPAGRDPGAIQNRTVSGTSDLSIIEGITDAQNYEVRVRIIVTTQRNPPVRQSGPWSIFLKPSEVLPSGSQTVPPTGAMSIPTGIPLHIIVIAAAVAGVVLIGIAILVIVCCCCYYRRRGGVYSIPSAEQKHTHRPTASFDYANDTISSNNATATFSHSSPKKPNSAPSAVTPPRSMSSSQEHLLGSSSGDVIKPPSNRKVTIAVVDTSSLEENKKPLANSDSWAEEFDQLEGLVNTLNDTVTSIASLPQNSPSPDPLPPPKNTPPAATGVSRADALVIDNMNTASQGSPDGGPKLSEAADVKVVENNLTDASGTVVENSLAKVDETIVENSLTNINETVVENNFTNVDDNDDNCLSDKEDIHAGSAKREDNFAPRVLEGKVLYPLMESDVSCSSRSSVSSASGHKEPLTTSNEQSEEVELQGHFIELLQFGDKEDLHMV